MNTKPIYTDDDLVPREITPFSRNQHARDVRRGWRVDPLPTTFDVKRLIQPQAVASIRKAFTLAKTSHDSWKNGQREGKVNIRTAMQARPTGSLAVFRSRKAPSTTRIKCYVVIDDSGSMRASDARIPHPDFPNKRVEISRYAASALFGATMVTALGSIPTVDLDVFYHSCKTAAHLTLKWMWHRGTPVTVFNRAAAGNNMSAGGNADGHALYALTQRMLREIRHGEHGIILMVSDGQPADSPDRLPQAALTDAVASARDRGITVIGISIDNSDQRAYYGDDMIQFDGDWTHLGGEIARLIGRATATH